MEKKMLAWIRGIGIYHKWFAGFVAFFGSGIMLLILSFPEIIPEAIEEMNQYGVNILYLKMYNILAMAISPISFIFGNGLLHLKKVSRKVILYLNIFSLFAFPFIAIRGNLNSKPASVLFGVILYSAIIYYLTRPKVKEQFK